MTKLDSAEADTHKTEAMRARDWQRIANIIIPVIMLVILFAWFYARALSQLFFVMDDYIETAANLARPLGATIKASFLGQMNWSGYRPLAYSVRAILAHTFGIEYITGYHLLSQGLHLANTLMVYSLLRRLFHNSWWSFFGAAVFLLLPSHNEAIFFVDANANPLALFFSLITLLAATQRGGRPGKYGMLAAWLAYGLAILSYEVVLSLPLFILLLDIIDKRSPLAKERRILFAGLLVVAAAALAARYFAAGTLLTSGNRSEYQAAFSLARMLFGYALLGGQIILLHTSPWADAAPFQNIREWLSLSNPVAIQSIVLALVASLVVLLLNNRRNRSPLVPRYLLLASWGLAWLIIVSLPFVALAGRNPENRYTYIPSLGFAVLLSATLGLVHNSLAAFGRVRHVVLLIPLGIMAVYGYVGASDLNEWTTAGRHMSAFMAQATTIIPELPDDSYVVEIGMPGHIGSTYLFTTDQGFHSAISLWFGRPKVRTLRSEENLKKHLAEMPEASQNTFVLVYDPEHYRLRQADWVRICKDENNCKLYQMATSKTTPENTNGETRFAGGITYRGHALETVYSLHQWELLPLLVTCWSTETANLPNYTLFVHLTDDSGAMVNQADHLLRQALPAASEEATLGNWPVARTICDAYPLQVPLRKPFESLTIKGGLWLPEQGSVLPIEEPAGVEIDPEGRLVFDHLSF